MYVAPPTPSPLNIHFSERVIFTCSLGQDHETKEPSGQLRQAFFLLFLQGISILGSKHFRVQTLPIYKRVLINMHGPIVFVESNPNQTPQDFTENHCNNASLLLRSWWFLSTAHVARSVISKAQALLLWVLPPHGDVRWTGEKRSSFYPDSSSSSWPKKENSVIQQDLKVIEVTQIALQKNKR